MTELRSTPTELTAAIEDATMKDEILRSSLYLKINCIKIDSKILVSKLIDLSDLSKIKP
jgi:hypothetical protein